MSAPTPDQVGDALDAAGLDLVYEGGWKDPGIAAPGTWTPAYVLLHHTANGGATGDAPSLPWILRNSYYPIRAAHLLVARSGRVHLTYARKCYHAGEGGPGRWGDGPSVSSGAMNGYAYGIEVESKGTSLDTSNSHGTNGYTADQVDATARAAAALLDLLKRSTGCAINHRTWAPTRKTDTLREDAWWHERIAPYRGGATPAPPDPETMRGHEMFILKTKDAKGAHYAIDSGRSVKIGAPYKVQGTEPTVLILAPDDDGSRFLKAYPSA